MNTIDTVLQTYAAERPINQLAAIDRAVLRIAVYELAVDTEIPIPAVIDEAIELAKLFGAENTSRFVNGVLGAVVESLNAIRDLFRNMIGKDAEA